MKILVTGAGGYIGSLLCDLLYDYYGHHEIVGIDNLKYRQGMLVHPVIKKIDFIHDDVRTLTQKYLQEFDLIIPLAAIVGAPACDKNPEEATDINLKVIQELCENISSHQRIIFGNTNSGYGTVKEGICTEETPLNSISLYAKLKDKAEQVVLQHPNSIVFRLATVFGTSYRTRIDLLVNTLLYEAVFHKKIELYDGNFRRNYIHIKDIIKGFIFAIDNFEEMKGNVYNLGNDYINTTKLELVQKISQYAPCTITQMDKEDPDQRDYIVSSEKLYKHGYQPTITLDTGIKELLKYYSYLPTQTQERKVFIKQMKNI